MFALFIILNKTDYLDDILTRFIKVGVTGATILDSQGMAGAIVDAKVDVPIFGFLKSILDDSKPYNKTIFTVLKDQEMVDKVIATVKQTLGKDAKPSAGFMFTVPLGDVYRLGD